MLAHPDLLYAEAGTTHEGSVHEIEGTEFSEGRLLVSCTAAENPLTVNLSPAGSLWRCLADGQ